MAKHPIIVAAALGIALAAYPLAQPVADVSGAQNLATAQILKVEPIQYAPDHRWNGGPRHGGPGLRAYPGWRGQPG